MMFWSLMLTSTSEGLICICLITSRVIIIESDAAEANEGAYLMHRSQLSIVLLSFMDIFISALNYRRGRKCVSFEDREFKISHGCKGS